MRKIREAIVASHRVDHFALPVYTFVIRTPILLKHMPSYHPALLHLLHKIHPMHPLSKIELEEFVGYQIFDLACRQNDLAAAYAIRYQYNLRSTKIDILLKSLVHGNWLPFWTLKSSMTVYENCLADSAENKMRGIALKALRKGYLKIQTSFFEGAVGCEWKNLEEEERQGWVHEGELLKVQRTQRS